MLHAIKIFLVTIGGFYLVGCVSALSVEKSAPNVKINESVKSVSIAVLDQRPYVLNQDKEPAFEGIFRTSLGIPRSRTTVTEEPMATFLGNRLESGIQRKGINVEQHSTDTESQLSELISTLKEDSKPSIIVVLNEWKYDYHAFTDSSWYDVDIIVTDRTGSKSLTKNYSGEDDIPSGDAIVNQMMLIYKARFEKIFADPELLNVIEE